MSAIAATAVAAGLDRTNKYAAASSISPSS
jgi:hypothetical protein